MQLAELPRRLLARWRRLRSRADQTRGTGRPGDSDSPRHGTDQDTSQGSVHVMSRIEEARRRFAGSLVGRWSEAVGTSGSVSDQHWEIRSDGTGLITDTGPFGAPRSVRQFEWRQHETGVFQLRIVKFVETNGEEHDLDESEEPWRVFRYDFIHVATDTGGEVGLVELSDDGERRKGFGESYAPLAYRGTAR